MSRIQPKIFCLIGFRGAGKTSLGERAANKLGWAFIDADRELSQELGIAIPDYILKNSLEKFRQEEFRWLNKFLAQSRSEEPLILALGGGGIESEALRQALQNQPDLLCIYLELGAEALWRRLSAEPERLKIGELRDLAALSRLLALRRPYYEELAAYTLKNEGDTQAALGALTGILMEFWRGSR